MREASYVVKIQKNRPGTFLPQIFALTYDILPIDM